MRIFSLIVKTDSHRGTARQGRKQTTSVTGSTEPRAVATGSQSQPILEIDLSWKSERRCQLSARIRSLSLSVLYRESLAHRIASRDPATHPTSFLIEKQDSADLLHRNTAHHSLCLCGKIPGHTSDEGSTNCPKCG